VKLVELFEDVVVADDGMIIDVLVSEAEDEEPGENKNGES